MLKGVNEVTDAQRLTWCLACSGCSVNDRDLLLLTTTLLLLNAMELSGRQTSSSFLVFRELILHGINLFLGNKLEFLWDNPSRRELAGEAARVPAYELGLVRTAGERAA